ncbi:AraC family transcriptional regulator [Lacisediminihabitans sp. H27-G8]|uniref:AraC family transcriptional regulator n=1 Tax=Lacisediminihabitans sp. H27-G8 TaxID=3111909 RepID=UPI0038FD214A
MLIGPDLDAAVIRDGFPGQRMLVLPRPRVERALMVPATRSLLVTDCGYFPHAQHHGRSRSIPIRQIVVIVCARGQGWCETRSGRFTVNAGQMILLPPGESHSYGTDEFNPWTLWWAHMDGLSVPDFVEVAALTSATAVRTVPDMYGTVGLIAEIIHWMERDSTDASLLRAAGAAWHLLSTVASVRAVTVGGTDDAIERAALYLREHVNRRVNVSYLAATAGMSSSYFAALFKKYTGVPVMAYQTQLRMASARELLDTTSRSIDDVAQAVGYDDSFYFARQFKNVHGMTPSAYRRHDKG